MNKIGVQQVLYQ